MIVEWDATWYLIWWVSWRGFYGFSVCYLGQSWLMAFLDVVTPNNVMDLRFMDLVVEFDSPRRLFDFIRNVFKWRSHWYWKKLYLPNAILSQQLLTWITQRYGQLLFPFFFYNYENPFHFSNLGCVIVCGTTCCLLIWRRCRAPLLEYLPKEFRYNAEGPPDLCITGAIPYCKNLRAVHVDHICLEDLSMHC